MLYLIHHEDQTDPRLNLALEEFAVRRLDIRHDYVLFYVDKPAVIIGRHQNPWQEVNLHFTDKNNIPVLRRISGGGTVYHDPGNLNFSFITRYDKWKFNNYRYFTEPIIQVLRSLHLPVILNGRNDIIIHNLKISGNAQFTAKDRMVSHGTLLFNAQLNDLSQALHLRENQIESRAIRSFHSPVGNISDFLRDNYSTFDFKNLLLRKLFKKYPDIPTYRFSENQMKDIRDLARSKYENWDWNYGESPDFTFRNSRKILDSDHGISLRVRHGRIEGVQFFGILAHHFDQIKEDLIHVRFLPEDIEPVIHKFLQLHYRASLKSADILNLICGS